MFRLKYVKLNEIEPEDLIPLLNKEATRAHLIDHELFDLKAVKDWIQSKVEMDSKPGCRVRAIMVGRQLAGWCGIQFEEGNYEMAVVIDDSYWGLGRRVFRDTMAWAKELGHTTIFIHLLHTRPEYRFLRKMSKNVCEGEIRGNRFTTYELEVNRFGRMD